MKPEDLIPTEYFLYCTKALLLCESRGFTKPNKTEKLRSLEVFVDLFISDDAEVFKEEGDEFIF